MTQILFYKSMYKE